ncbi:hypothetical protein RJ55_03173 [Drechmeria coniospora]|nr:hypothetical protein RJ55_03173 [Drechmeria coniospora]
MPAPGDQHTSWANPFEETRSRISEWTARDIATISSKLDKQLGPEYISSRSGPGGSRVHYLTAEKCICLANEVFGFNGWSSSIQNIQVDFADENPQTQRVSIGLSVIVRVTLRDGTFHEDIGYGSIENAKGKAMAFEKAKKEGTTDGLKRALRSFGNVLGNCIYDQDYVKQVTKVKAQPVKKFDQVNLHRHADFITVKPEPANAASAPAPATTTTTTAAAAAKTNPSESFEDFFGELDEADFCVPGDGHPDEIIIPHPRHAQESTATNPPAQKQPPSRQLNRVPSAGSGARPPQTPHPVNSRPIPNQDAQQHRATGTIPGKASPVEAAQPHAVSVSDETSNAPVAFFSAKSVVNTDSNAPSTQHKHLFNPKAESPSIRKTPGIDHSSSKPVGRNMKHVPPTNSQTSPAPVSTSGPSATGVTSARQSANGGPITRSNLVNPSLDHTRRIGAPSGPSSPLANRGAYKPPSMKRPLPADGSAAVASRSALADVPTNTTGLNNTTATDAIDTKRQKMT